MTAPPVASAPPRSRSTTVAVLLFVLVVLALSALLVRVREGRSASAAGTPVRAGGAAAPGSIAVLTLDPLLHRRPLPGSVTVALVRDPASAAWYDSPATYDSLLAHWRRALDATGATVREVAPAALASDRSGVIVVPAAPCLSPETRAALTTARRGRGVVFSWLTGTRDHGCRTVGYGLLAALVGAGRADTLPSSTQPFLTVPAGGPLAIDVPPGARIELRPSTHVAVRHPSRDAHWSDRDLNPIGGVGGAPLTDGALVHASSGTDRTVYLGFELQTVVDRPWEREIAALLVRNAVAWAVGRPLAAPDAWPRGRVAAAVLSQDVEDEFANARGALDTLRATGVPATFFVVSDIARDHQPLLRDLARYGEIGSHSENHVPLGGGGAELQRARLLDTQRDLAALVGRPVGGLRPPEEKFDRETMDAWHAAGGWYLFGANDGRTASPELFAIGDKRMVLLGRVADDDFLTVRRAGMVDPAQIAGEQLDALRKVRALGGLYILSYHSNMLARPATIAALGRVARALRADSTLWLTTTGEVARWWLQRDGLVATADVIDGAVRVTARNEGSAATPPAVVVVSLPMARPPRALADGTALLPAPPGTARVPVPTLAPGATHTLTIELAKETTNAP